MNDKYLKIINMDRPKSSRPPMPISDRAAQFAPFAALKGHDELLSDTAQSFVSEDDTFYEESEEIP